MRRRLAIGLVVLVAAAGGIGATFVGGKGAQAFVDGHHFGYIRALIQAVNAEG